jgi:hypothetical protein
MVWIARRDKQRLIFGAEEISAMSELTKLPD